MKKLIIIVLSLCLALIVVGPVFASGYRTDTAAYTTQSPHGGYLDTTNYCKVCHAVHGANSGYKLLRNTTVATECDACHGSSGVVTDHKVQADSQPGHRADGTDRAIDDSSKGTITAFRCKSCHSVHGLNVAAGSTAKILKDDPASDGGAETYTTNSDDRGWCGDCHDYNEITAKNLGSHVMTTVAGTYATANSDTCRDCHNSGNSGTNKWPHESSDNDLLEDGWGGTNLDDVCRNCHNDPDLIE